MREKSKAFETALALIQAELTGEKIAKKLVVPPPKELEELPRIRESLERRQPKGVVVPLTMEVGDEFVDAVGPQPWFSFMLFNQGPNAVWVCVNRKSKQQGVARKIEKEQRWKVTIGEAKIRHVYLVCEPGETATVDIDGVY